MFYEEVLFVIIIFFLFSYQFSVKMAGQTVHKCFDSMRHKRGNPIMKETRCLKSYFYAAL